MRMLISYQTNIRNAKDLQRKNINEILTDIQKGKYKNEIDELRKLGKNSNEFKELKNSLPYFVPALFKDNERKKDKLERTQYLLFDIDEKQFKEANITISGL